MAQIRGLTEGTHGFHIHTYGDVRSNDGTSAGGHLTNPHGADIAHGLPQDTVRHWGDLGNVVVGRDGRASFSQLDRVIRLAGVLGRSFVVHELTDRGVDEQPTGGAGARQASCVIGFANPEL